MEGARAARRSGSRAATFLLFVLALACAGTRAPDGPTIAGVPSLRAVHESFVAVVPERITGAVRPAAPTGNRQWLAAASADDGGALPGQAPAAVAAAHVAIAAGSAGAAARVLRAPSNRVSARPFDARAPPATA